MQILFYLDKGTVDIILSNPTPGNCMSDSQQ